MRTYIKAQAASIIGSLADFLVSILLHEVFHCWYIVANISGNICGAVIQFILSRNWAFEAGNILLQTAGVYVLKNYFNLSYILSKTIASVMIGLTYNYFVQKKFVFA
jgi:putative flippase GtrA